MAQVLNHREFTSGSVQHWEPDMQWAEATGATANVGLSSDEKVYASGIRNETSKPDGYKYITQAQYADGLLKARRAGWDGVDYTDARVAELKHRMYASLTHDKMLAEAKRKRIEKLQKPEAKPDDSAWSMQTGSDESIPAKLHKG
ncbi:hypothetical protein EXU30_19725 [Shewanella maritima]|uniref:Uncharacterized protein n=1 Tax=Shewanella maritima TaxID=2520507 RepID=A0A411PMC2_9GAMM|nr:hypothetical protein [Shewanella maritima]QBF84655.1 hypothetical protein EXU30_19725 [Shewanella maritima]